MAKRATTLSEAVSVVSGLSPLDRIRLLERLASMLEDDLVVSAGESVNPPRESPAAKPTFAGLATWLNSNPPEEAWGDLGENQDAAEYVHRMRRQMIVQLDDPGDNA